jgi:adenosine kinase
MSTSSYQLFCIGNPLLDIQVTKGEEVLKKYDLKANDAILAEEKHLPLYVQRSSSYFPLTNERASWNSYDEIVKEYKVTYVAGGASQNTARGAAVSAHREMLRDQA